MVQGFWEFGDIPQLELEHQPDRVTLEKKTLADNLLQALEAYGSEGMLLLSQRRGQVRLIPRGDGTGTPVDTQIDDDDGWTQLDAIYRMRKKLSQFVSINSYYGADLKDTNDAIKSGDLIHHLMTVTKPLLAKIGQDGTDCHWLETGHEVRTILRGRFALHSEAPKIVEALDKFSHHKGPSPPQPACAIYVDMINTISTAFESFIDDKAHTIDDRSE